MATDVTAKLISLSLGKIQQSRQIKSGLNLRKSLLVASVLHKAKDIYMTEIRSRRNVDSTDQLKPSKSKKPRFASQKSVVDTDSNDTENESSSQNLNNNNDLEDSNHASTTVPESVQSSTGSTMDLEAETAAACDSILDELAMQSEPAHHEEDDEPDNKENSPPECTTTNNDKITSSRVESLSFRPCLKRRCSQVDSYDSDTCESDSEADSPPQTPAKRTRVQADPDSGKQSTEERSSQINSLVHIFSAGFSTFAHPNSSDNGYSGMDKSSTCYSQSTATSTELNTFSLCSESIALTA